MDKCFFVYHRTGEFRGLLSETKRRPFPLFSLRVSLPTRLPDPTALEHAPMQYDLSATTYSPDGRLFQIEYAQKAIDNAP